MSTLVDPEFGHITIRRSPSARSIRLRVAPDGRLRASMPVYTPVFLLKKMLKDSRSEIRAMITDSSPTISYEHGMMVGKSHALIIRHESRDDIKVSRHDRQLLAEIPQTLPSEDMTVQRHIRDEVIKILRREAKAYLPRRLEFLARKHGFRYETVRFSHASSRWGSCSSNGTISLNIALMKLPFELIDYVLIHELSHTREMNHSKNFWMLVEAADSEYREHRRALKSETPTI